MDIDKMINVSMDMMDAVTDAVNRGDFSDLNATLQRMIRPGSVRKGLFAALGCAVLLACLVLVPSPQDRTAEARKALTKTLREGRETIARAAEEDEANLTEEEKKELRKNGKYAVLCVLTMIY